VVERFGHKPLASVKPLAFDSGFDRTFISLVERGVRSPTVRSLVKLAEVLQVPSSEILARMEMLLKDAKHQRTTPG
jgi:transcriptional regulator with XRE-family HTH domain